MMFTPVLKMSMEEKRIFGVSFPLNQLLDAWLSKFKEPLQISKMNGTALVACEMKGFSISKDALHVMAIKPHQHHY